MCTKIWRWLVPSLEWMYNVKNIGVKKLMFWHQIHGHAEFPGWLVMHRPIYEEFRTIMISNRITLQQHNSFSSEIKQIVSKLVKAMTTATSFAWYSLHGWGVIYPGWSHQQKEFAVFCTGIWAQGSTVPFWKCFPWICCVDF